MARAWTGAADNRGVHDRGRVLLLILSVVAVVATAVTPITVATSQEADPTQSHRVAHTPVTVADYGQPIGIEASSLCVVDSCSLTLLYRTTAASETVALDLDGSAAGWTAEPLSVQEVKAVEGGHLISWAGAIPAGAVMTSGVDYLLQLQDESGIAVSPPTAYYHVEVLTPPTVIHHPVVSTPADTAIAVEAQSPCATGSCDATLYFRVSDGTEGSALTGVPDWDNRAMVVAGATQLPDGRQLVQYTAEIPAEIVDTPGVDYIIRVEDGAAQAWSPGTRHQGAYAKQDGIRLTWHHIHVTEPTHVIHAPVPTAEYGQPLEIEATATCPATRSCTATLWHRTTDEDVTSSSESDFGSSPMSVTREAGTADEDLVTLRGEIPAELVDTRGVDYFLAIDDGSTRAWWPGTSHTNAYGVATADGTRVGYHHVWVTEPPHVVHGPPTPVRHGEPLTITADVTCVTEQCTIDLFHTPDTRAAGATAFFESAMVDTGVEVDTPFGPARRYTATVPAEHVTTRGVSYFFRARDGHTTTYEPGTFYVGAYVPMDGQHPGNAAFVSRVVEPPQVVHVPVVTAQQFEPVEVSATATCATAGCEASLWWRHGTSGPWELAMMSQGSVSKVDGVTVLDLSATIPPTRPTLEALQYRIQVTDGYTRVSTLDYPVAIADRPASDVVGQVYADRDATPGFSPDADLGYSDATLIAEGAGLDGSFGTIDDTTVKTTTGQDGFFWITDLVAGDYRLRIDAETLPEGAVAADPVRTFTVDSTTDHREDFVVSEPDSDGDGVVDVVEYRLGVIPEAVDTDGDGLSDAFELDRLFTVTDANVADTDGDGTGDADEDPDSDGLTNAQEQEHGTNPLSPDSDGDGLDDPAEMGFGSDPTSGDADQDGLPDPGEQRLDTDPNDPDTDDDGVLDGDDDHEFTLTGPANSTVTVRGTGDLGRGLTITEIDDAALMGTPGAMGAPIDIVMPDRAALSTADITFSFDPAQVESDPADLRVFWFNPARGLWEPATQQQTVDETAGTVTATVDHFSLYALFDLAAWVAFLDGRLLDCNTDDVVEPDTVPVDLMLVIDSSGSMSSNDPNELRISAAQGFTELLIEVDRSGAVDFDTAARVWQLTSDHDATSSWLSGLDASGGTDLGVGVAAALDELARDPVDSKQYVVMLTDGIGDYDDGLTQRAADAGIPVFTIGLGSSPDEELLRSIADGTRGAYYHADQADELRTIFDQIAQGTLDGTERDLDRDGLPDCVEIAGVQGLFGPAQPTDPLDADSDDDTLPDGVEAGEPILLDEAWPWLADVLDRGVVYPLHSDPTQFDTDKPDEYPIELNDGAEYGFGSHERLLDSDGDGADDAMERHFDTDPHGTDSDGDGLDDFTEMLDPDRHGLDPAMPDRAMTPTEWMAEYERGFFAGDLGDPDSVPEVLGNIASGLGLEVIADIRDVIGSFAKGDWVGLGFNATGLVPIFGSASDATGVIRRFAAKHADQLDELAEAVAGSTRISEASRIELLRMIHRGQIDDLISRGVNNEVILALTSGGRRLDHALEAVRRAQVPSKSPAGFMADWRDGERWLRHPDNYAGVHPRGRGFADPACAECARRWRIVDSWDAATKTAREAKVGYQNDVNRVLEQIAKDKRLLTAQEFDALEWHFFASAASHSVGADPRILDALDEAGIPYFIHLPETVSDVSVTLP